MKKIKLLSLAPLLLIIFASFAYSQLADSAWPMYRHDPQHTGRSQYKGPENPKLLWKFETDGYVLSEPAIDIDGSIYFGSYDCNFYSIFPNGNLKWRITSFNYIRFTPAIGIDGTIYWDKSVFLYNLIYYLSAVNRNGMEKWAFKFKGHYNVLYPILSSPVIGENGIIYISTSEDLYHLPYTGFLNAIYPNCTLKWEFKTEEILSDPALGIDGTIYVSSNSYLYAIDGLLKWKFEMGSYGSTSPAIGADGVIYVGSSDFVDDYHSYHGYLFAINPDGSLKWKFQAGNYVSTPAIGTDGTIYLPSRDGFLYALNPDGSLKWQSPVGLVYYSPSIDSDGVIYVGSSGYLYAVNPNGTLKWKIKIGNFTYSPPAIGPHSVIYIGTDYSLTAIGETPTLKPIIQFGLHIDPEKENFKNGDSFELKLDFQTPSTAKSVDVYFVMVDQDNKMYFGLDWGMTGKSVLEDYVLPENLKISGATLMTITIPSQKPLINNAGTYTFAFAAMEPDTMTPASNIATVSFKYE